VILPRRVFRAVAGSAFAQFLAAHGLPAAAGAATPPGAAAEPAFAPAALAAMDAAIDASILAGRAPGGVLWLGRSGIDHVRAHGLRAVEPAAEATTPDTIYDAASLTKVVVTATAVLQQVERGQLILDAPVARWLPAFAAHGKGAITVRHLLTHRSGLRPGLGLQPAWSGRAAALALAQRLGAVVALKGHGTVTSDGLRAWRCDRGGAALATGGSGDVLAGVIGAFFAQFAARDSYGAARDSYGAARDSYGVALAPGAITALAVDAHARAGDLWAARHGDAGALAREIADLIPEAMHAMRAGH
jgi:hypothetical protein